MIEHEDLQWHRSGQAHLTGSLARLLEAIDQKLIDAMSSWSFESHYVPAFICVDQLQKMDYLHSFPQHATFAVTLNNDAGNLQSFRQQPFAETETGCACIDLTELSPAEQLLTPAACYHIYRHQQSNQLTEPSYHSTRATCYRREAYYQPLIRQWNFSMREFVCIGDEGGVENFVAQATAAVDGLLDEWGIPVSHEVATDPFFDPSNNPKFVMQKIQPNKHEWVFGEGLAVGSANRHRNYFGENFQISCHGEPAYSACVAFGLERWISMILTHFGDKPSDWPTEVLV